MTIGTNDFIDKFGTQDRIDDTSTSSIANDAFSVAADIATWTNDDDAPFCVMVLMCQWATAPDDGSIINIYARKLNVEGTNDSPAPSTANQDQIIGFFTVDGDVATATDAYHVTDWMTLPNHYSSQQYDFYLENKTGQTISANWDMWITPVTKGPHG